MESTNNACISTNLNKCQEEDFRRLCVKQLAGTTRHMTDDIFILFAVSVMILPKSVTLTCELASYLFAFLKTNIDFLMVLRNGVNLKL